MTESMARLTRAERNEAALVGNLAGTNLGTRALNGTMLAFAGQLTRMLVQIASTAILSRLLLPADFGLVAMAFTVTSFVTMFTDLGLSVATLQREKISQESVSTLLFINIFVGVALMLVTCVTAPIAAWVYGDVRVTWLTIAISLAIPISAIGAQHSALLGRSMRWIPIQISYTVAQLGGLAVALGSLLLLNVGYWALALQTIASAFFSTIVVWRACDWRPSLVCNWRAAREEIKFGLHLTGFNLANWFHRQLDNVLIGWRWGSVELGYYSRAYNILIIPINFVNGPIGSAVLPLLSRFQSKAAEWKHYYGIALIGSTIAGYWMACLFYLSAGEIIELVLGPRWDKAAEIFALLALGMFASTPMNTTGWIYMSLGRTHRFFLWGLIGSAVYVSSFIIGLPHGATGVARAYTIAQGLSFLPGLAFATKGTHISLREALRLLVGPMLVAAATIFLTLHLVPGAGANHLLLAIMIKSAVATAIFFALALLLLLFDPTYAGAKGVASRLIARTASYIGFTRARQATAIQPSDEAV